jgi:hypothetical protein
MQTTAQINKRKRKLRELGEQIGGKLNVDIVSGLRLTSLNLACRGQQGSTRSACRSVSQSAVQGEQVLRSRSAHLTSGLSLSADDRSPKSNDTGDNVGINVLDAKNMLTLTDTVYKISKKDRADANTFDINDFLEP